jgi:hypothetical protein
MAGMVASAWLVLAAVAPELNPEALLGMLAPLVSALVTWVVVARTAAVAPEKTTGVMVIGLAVKMVFFGVYVAGMLKGAELRPVPFMMSFAGSFIALHAIEAMFLRRLFAEMGRSTEPAAAQSAAKRY